jgi:hypothetical protein
LLGICQQKNREQTDGKATQRKIMEQFFLSRLPPHNFPGLPVYLQPKPASYTEIAE